MNEKIEVPSDVVGMLVAHWLSMKRPELLGRKALCSVVAQDGTFWVSVEILPDETEVAK